MITLDDIKKRMSKLDNWAIDGNSIVKETLFPTFKEAMVYVNKVADIAEKREHHPEIIITFSEVRLRLTTHDENNITEKDFDMAEEIDKIGS